MTLKLKYKYFAIDFDGTIAYDAYPHVGKLIPGAKETMDAIIDKGGEIAIWTCRTGEAKDNAIRFLIENQIPFTKFNKPFDENVNIYGGDNARKIFADIYIDDRSLHFAQQPVDWVTVQDIIFSFDEWEVGDTIEAIEDCMGNFRKGEQFVIKEISEKEDSIVFGPVRASLYDTQELFKKVN